MFFDSVQDLVRVIIIGLLAYGGCVVLLRISGNRTLSKMNSFDLVVTVAIGSTLSSILLTRSISLSEGWLALALLVGVQFVITWLSVRSATVSTLVKTRPTLILRDGRMLVDTMRTVRITEDELRGAVRQHGIGGMELVAAAILETDGSLSIVPRASIGSGSALEGVAGAPAGGA